MKLSELIVQGVKALAEHGDLNVRTPNQNVVVTYCGVKTTEVILRDDATPHCFQIWPEEDHR